MSNTDRAIWQKFGIARRDNLPFVGKGSRVQLAELFGQLGFKTGAEIGVYTGQYSDTLLACAPGLTLLCVDPWAGRRMAGHFVRTQRRLEKYGDTAKIMRMTSVEAAKLVPDRSLDFVYIDALHDFSSVMLDILLWAPKVKPGGIVSGHDYVCGYQIGVIPAVDAFVRGHNIQNLYLTREWLHSWFWVG